MPKAISLPVVRLTTASIAALLLGIAQPSAAQTQVGLGAEIEAAVAGVTPVVLPPDFGERVNAAVQGKLSEAELSALAKAGYADHGEQVALNILGVTPAYISELAAVGYKDLSVDDLLSFRALGVSAAFIRGAQKPGEAKLTPEQIVERRALASQKEAAPAAPSP